MVYRVCQRSVTVCFCSSAGYVPLAVLVSSHFNPSCSGTCLVGRRDGSHVEVIQWVFRDGRSITGMVARRSFIRDEEEAMVCTIVLSGCLFGVREGKGAILSCLRGIVWDW